MQPLLTGALLANLLVPAQTGYLVPSPTTLSTPGLSNLWAAPLGALGLAPPLGMGVPLIGVALHPTMQMAPNLLSHQHLQYLTNPYLGGWAASNPYLRSSLPNPFAPPAFAPRPSFGGGYGTSMQSLPFTPLLSLPAVPKANPYVSSSPAGPGTPAFMAPSARLAPSLFDLSSWFKTESPFERSQARGP